MAGNSNSGRPKLYEEWNKISAINKLWAKVNRKVESGEELSEYEEKLVLSLLPKTIRTDIGLGGLDGKSLVVKIDGEIANKYNINGTDTEPKDNSEGQTQV